MPKSMSKQSEEHFDTSSYQRVESKKFSFTGEIKRAILQLFGHKSKNRKQKIITISVFILFAIIYSSISLVNHYYFRTHALDLGLYNNAIYGFANFSMPKYTLDLSGVEQPFFATHFSLITILYAPFYYIFGSYTLLIIQISSILFAGYYIQKYIKQHIESFTVRTLLLVQFFSIWGIYSALSFDFHNSVIGAMLVPALFYYIEKRDIKVSALIFMLFLFTKEIMAIWGIFILIGLMIKNRNTLFKQYIKLEIPLLIAAIIYGSIVLFWAMPKLQLSDTNLQFGRYAHLGNSLWEMLTNILRNPQIIFSNTSGDAIYDGIKAETIIMFLLAGGVFCIIRPAYLFMLLPIFAQKFLSSDCALWGINYHYSIEFVPILALATIDVLSNIKKVKLQNIIAITAVILTISSTFQTMESCQSKWYNEINTQFYKKAHYQSDINRGKVFEIIEGIPSSTTVSTSSALAPRLAFREKIFLFPNIKNAGYIILLKKEGTYPLSLDELASEVEKLKAGNHYEAYFESETVIAFKKVL